MTVHDINMPGMQRKTEKQLLPKDLNSHRCMHVAASEGSGLHCVQRSCGCLGVCRHAQIRAMKRA